MHFNLKTILVTGSVGFIGSALVNKLLAEGYKVIGIDNHNEHYDGGLKENRLKIFNSHENYIHHRLDITNFIMLEEVFKKYKPVIVINLAALAGVRYSVENPIAYVNSNINGFANIIECARKQNVKHFIYASSSSIYGAEVETPFSTMQKSDTPLNIYAATKKSNELIAHSYSHLYGMNTSGLRFFTVYGPWGRPDMALFKFTKLINENKPIQIYNNGLHKRDFTYIDDIVAGILLVLKGHEARTHEGSYEILNIGRGHPVSLLAFIEAIENALEKKATKEFLPAQEGDMLETYADISPITKEYGYSPKMNIQEGVNNFIKWYLEYEKQIKNSCRS